MRPSLYSAKRARANDESGVVLVCETTDNVGAVGGIECGVLPIGVRSGRAGVGWAVRMFYHIITIVRLTNVDIRDAMWTIRSSTM